jgi:hypothetical protein
MGQDPQSRLGTQEPGTRHDPGGCTKRKNQKNNLFNAQDRRTTDLARKLTSLYTGLFFTIIFTSGQKAPGVIFSLQRLPILATNAQDLGMVFLRT